jgi:hypothetical protein
MSKLDNLDKLFVYWSFFFQIVLIVHFAFRKRLFESYSLKYGWLVYALCIPAAVISLVLLLGGKSWYFWLGGFLFVIYASYGADNRVPLCVPISINSYVLLVAACKAESTTLDCLYSPVCHCSDFEYHFTLSALILAPNVSLERTPREARKKVGQHCGAAYPYRRDTGSSRLLGSGSSESSPSGRARHLGRFPCGRRLMQSGGMACNLRFMIKSPFNRQPPSFGSVYS